MEKNDVFEGACEALGTNGEGIVRYGGYTVFVPYLLAGEKARVRVLKVKGGVAYGKAEEILIPAEERVRPACSAFFRCGGCQLQHMRYRAQLRFKTELVKNALQKIGGIDVPVAACERSEKEYGYRNKLQLPVGRVGGENAIGFYAERSHRIVKTDECPIHPAWSKALIEAMYRFMDKCGLDGYDEATGGGQIRRIVVREVKGKFLVTLVATVSEIKGIDYLYYLLNGIFPEYSFYLSVHTGRDNVAVKDPVLLRGKGVYEGSEGGIVYEAGASTFLQVNDNVRAKLYDTAASLISREDTVVDCYAGGGLLTAMFAKRCKKAYGIEVVPEANACADLLKEKNGLLNMENLCGTVETVLPALLEREKDATLVFDPPRAGIDRTVLKEVLRCGARKIVLISCDPSTLARDVGILTGTLTETADGALVKTAQPQGAYRAELVKPFDMFPQTRHVETLVLLVKN